jgi:uncharacterized protein YdeI (BOF family)
LSGRTRFFCIIAGLLLGAVATATAWTDRLEGLVMPISEAQEKAESGDRFAIEGVVVESKSGRVFTLRDDSGEMYILIPDFLVRKHGTPKRNEVIRVAGRFDKKHLDPGITGMKVQDLERLGKQGARVGSPSGEEEATSGAEAARTRPAPASPGQVRVKSPSVPAEWKERLGDARDRLLAAEKDVQVARTAYARALRDAGSKSAVDPAITARMDAAEAELAQVRREMPKLVEDARQAGVDPKLLSLYEDMNRPR